MRLGLIICIFSAFPYYCYYGLLCSLVPWEMEHLHDKISCFKQLDLILCHIHVFRNYNEYTWWSRSHWTVWRYNNSVYKSWRCTIFITAPKQIIQKHRQEISHQITKYMISNHWTNGYRIGNYFLWSREENDNAPRISNLSVELRNRPHTQHDGRVPHIYIIP